MGRGLEGGTADQSGTLGAGEGYGYLQDLLLLAPVDGQNLVIQQPGNGLGEIVIELIHCVLLRVLGLADEVSSAHDQFPKGFADRGIVGQVLRNDVAGTLEGILHGIDLLFRVQVAFRQRSGVGALLGEDGSGQWVQTLLPGDGGPGAALLLIGPVQVLHLRHGTGSIDGGFKLSCELSLIFNGFLYLVPAGLKVAQIGKAGFQGSKGGIVHGTVELLAVAGNEGNGVSLVDEGDDIFHIFRLLIQLPGQNFRYGRHSISFSKQYRQVS